MWLISIIWVINNNNGNIDNKDNIACDLFWIYMALDFYR